MTDLETRFDAELRRAARSLVTEDLPRGVLDQSVSAALGQERAVDGSIAAGSRSCPTRARAVRYVSCTTSSAASGPTSDVAIRTSRGRAEANAESRSTSERPVIGRRPGSIASTHHT